ncbi:MAG: precorrin-6y C5,15-methyltransferase (decarboxylating) subunit CbiE [Deltaproteobacteria bacterium]|nr:precorrin-6y C5,15-methyltransferase (decarboxylating) subunit CbiE [Deltaproteobacteria bacterium]
MIKQFGRQSDETSEAPIITILGLDNPADLTPSAQDLLRTAKVVAGPKRLLDIIQANLHLSAQTLPLVGNLNNWLEEIRLLLPENKIVILADGDPNFFGLGAKVIKSFGQTKVTMLPAVTTVQKAFALMGVTWAGVEVVSLHGRTNYAPFFSAVFRASQISGTGKLAVYTDNFNNPNLIAAMLIDRGQNNWKLTVFQDLGLASQSVWSGSLAQASKEIFSPLNLTVLERTNLPEILTIGAPESAYDHQAGLITKSEVRTAALGLLELKGHETMWDLGCGSGSISLEAGLILRHGQLYAVEKDPERAAQARLNRSRYGLAHLEIIEGQSLEVLPDLPRPDRVFIGGGGFQLEALLQAVLGCLSPGGLVVAAVVKLDSLATVLSSLSATGQLLSVTQLNAARGELLAGSLYLKPINPVFLIKGQANQ